MTYYLKQKNQKKIFKNRIISKKNENIKLNSDGIYSLNLRYTIFLLGITIMVEKSLHYLR